MFKKSKKLAKAMKIFDELLRPNLTIKTLWGAEHIVLKDIKPNTGQAGEIQAISVIDFVTLFIEPILKKQISAEELKEYSKKKGFGWEYAIDCMLKQ
jgi:hypothetical protein